VMEGVGLSGGAYIQRPLPSVLTNQYGRPGIGTHSGIFGTVRGSGLPRLTGVR
jgi:hypothetical protein